ncbi:MAG: DUF3747 domain-containing protein [Coleofasciculus sp. G1-WW12-02]|uniref:DUF3747 domain-containing protein n=1 Tax=unclassified Coleofasciculus TaxID=2692782 RepID=UPI0033016206
MRKRAFFTQVATLATIALSSLIANKSVAATFEQIPVEQNKFIAIAAPFGESSHQLLIIEQKSNARDCWSESGSNPVIVDPLLLNFDFTGICGRSTDSNGYSIRVAGQDLGLDYLLRIVRRDGELLLVGTNSRDRNAPDIVVGRTQGLANGFVKILLEPGWEFARRSYQGKALGHIYLANSQSLSSIGTGSGSGTGSNPGSGSGTGSNPGSGSGTGSGSGGGTMVTFPDIANDIYANEIQQAVAMGFIAGFREDNTFRPQAVLTREQLVSIIFEAMNQLPNANLQLPTQVLSRPYPDVDPSRWSAAKIQWARDNNIISGYADGRFRPTQPVTRAELMAMERRAAEFALSLQGQQPTLTGNQSALEFNDTQGHWADALITQMSAYCRVASPLNERGNAFSPNSQAQRNYAAAATVRMLNCVK